MALTPRKTYPELTALTAPVVDSDVLALYRTPGPLRRTTAAVLLAGVAKIDGSNITDEEAFRTAIGVPTPTPNPEIFGGFAEAAAITGAVGLTAKENYALTGWTVQTFAGLRLEGNFAALTAPVSAPAFAVLTGDTTLENVTLTGFTRPIYISEAQASGTYDFNGVRLTGNLTENISFRNVFDRSVVRNSVISGGRFRGVSWGYDGTDVEQAGWGDAVGLNITVTGVEGSPSGSQTAGLISYASRTVFSGCRVEDLGDALCTGEVDGIYWKSPRARVHGNYVSGLETSSTAKYQYNQKGSARGTAGVTLGFGGTFYGNVGVGKELGETGMQLQAGEATAAINHYENVKFCYEIGSLTGDGAAIGETFALGNNETNSMAITGSSTAAGSQLNIIGGRYRNFKSGMKFVGTGGFRGVNVIGAQFELSNTAGLGVTLEGTVSNLLRDVVVSNARVKGGSRAVNLVYVKGAQIHNPRHDLPDANPLEPVLLTNCQDIHIREVPLAGTLSGTTTGNIYQQLVYAGAPVRIRWTMVGTSTDNTEMFAKTVEASAWNDGGTVVIQDVVVVMDSESMAMVGSTIIASGQRFLCRFSAGAGLDWRYTGTIDIDQV